MVSRANRKGLEVGGHIATYQSAASLYEVGFNHFFRGKDHPGGGDQIYIQGHASPGIYARAFLEGRLTEDAARPLPPGGPARRGPGPVVVPAPAADAGLLGVPDGVDGPDRRSTRSTRRGSTATCTTAASRTPRQQHVWAFLGDGEMGEPESLGAIGARRPRGARQPHLRHQLQPAAARRPGARQRQDHPGAGVDLPRRRLERHQGRLGPRVGRPARPRRRRRAGQQDEQHPRRPVPDLLGRDRRLHPRALLRRRPAAAQDGRAHVRRADREAAARRPRLPQGVRRVRGRDQARRPADGDPGPDHQGLDDRRPRGQERHPPDEEAEHRTTSRSSATGSTCRSPTARSTTPTRPTGAAPFYHPGEDAPRSSTCASGAARSAVRCPSAGSTPTPAQAARRRGVRRAQAGLGQAARSPPRWPSSGCSRTDEGPGDRPAHRADRARTSTARSAWTRCSRRPRSTTRPARATSRSTASCCCPTRSPRRARCSTRASPRPARWPRRPPPARRTPRTASR